MMIKLAGGAYLIYLGLRMLLKKPDRPASGKSRNDADDKRAHRTIFQ